MVDINILARKFVTDYYTSLTYSPENIINFYSNDSKQSISVGKEVFLSLRPAHPKSVAGRRVRGQNSD